ncbi:AsmA-like C-terminal region-containing protein [Candidatus Halobeggiatoa sp. HSG11]|nr:AsmA-like C-terminal region-containing protein [Candidatus Halobeggiatoa sp. HSG11]
MAIFPQNKILRWSIWFIFLVGLISLLIVTIFAKLPNYKTQVEHQISAAVEQPVTIKLIKTYWTNGSPTIVLQQLQLLEKDSKKPAITVANVKVILNLWQSLLQWQVITDKIIIQGGEFAVNHNQNGQISLVGLISKKNSNKPTDLTWLSKQAYISLQIDSLNWLEPNLPLLTFSDLKLAIARQDNISKLTGSVKLPNHSIQQLKAESLAFASSFNIKNQRLNIDGQVTIEKLQYSQSIPQLITSYFQIRQQADGIWYTTIKQQISDSEQWFDHKVKLALTPPKTLQPAISFLLPHLTIPPTKFAITDLNGQINNLHLENLFALVPLDEFAPELTENLSVTSGNLYNVKWNYNKTFQIEADFSNLILALQQAKVRNFSGHLTLNSEAGKLDIDRATIVPTDFPVILTRVKGSLDFKRWQVSTENLQARVNKIPIQVAGDVTMDEVLKSNLLITVKNTKLEKLFKQIPDQNIVQQLTDAKLTGYLNKAQIFLQSIGTELKFKVKAFVEQMAIKNYQFADSRKITVQDLTGQLEIDSDKSSFAIKQGKIKLDLRDLYSKPLKFKDLQGKLTWRGENLTIKQLQAFEDKTKIQINGKLKIPQNGKIPYAELVVNMANGKLSKISSYLPNKKIPEVVRWLKNSQLKGDLNKTKAIVRGPIDDLMEKLEFKTDFKNASVKYADDWPMLTHAKGKIIIKDQNLVITANKGKSLKMKLHKPLKVKINDVFNAAAVDVTVNVKDKISDGLHFVENTPLLRDIIKLEQLDLQGQLGLNLNLSIPLSEEDIVINTQLTFSDTTIRDKLFDVVVTDVNGVLKFEKQQIFTENVRGKLRGTPVKLSLSTQTNQTPQRTVLKLNTIADPEFIFYYLQHFVPATPQLPPFLAGKTPLAVKIDFPNSSDDYIDIDIQTAFNGMAVNLPAPIGKKADKSKQLAVKLHIDSYDEIVIRSSYGKVFNNVFTLKQSQLERGYLSFGNKLAELPKEKILKVQGSLSDLSVTDWLESFKLDSSDSETDYPLPVVLVDLDLDKFEVAGQQLSDVKLQAKYKTFSAWQAAIKSDKIEGQVTFQQNKVDSDFKKLILSVPKTDDDNKSKSSPPNPHKLPILSFNCDLLKIADANLGRVKLQTKPSDDGIKLNLSTKSTHMDLRAEGQWRYVVGQHQTRLKATLDSDDIGFMMQQFGYSEPPIVGGASKISLNSYWFDAPYAVNSANLVGTLNIITMAGNIVAIEPPGVGRVFGLFDVYSLPRRLDFDFRDVFDKGFGFDTIAGNFFIKKGIARTDQFIIQGPSARIKIDGSTYLVDKTYDQIVTVYPHFSTPIAVAGALALGLSGGAVGLIVQQALQKELEPVINFQYHITGSWDEPEILSIDVKGK